MRNLYNEFFYIPKHGKVREKVVFTRMITTIAVVVFCLAAMTVTAYACFSYNITSGSSTIKAAHFETEISIQIIDENGDALDIKPLTSNRQTHKVTLEAGKLYTVTIASAKNSTAKTGFVVMRADGCDSVYHTQQLGKDEMADNGETPSICFTLLLTDSTEVRFLAHWGTSSYYDAYKNKGKADELYVTDNEKVTLIVNGFTTPNIPKTEDKTNSTTESTHETETTTSKNTVTTTTTTTTATATTTTTTTTTATTTTATTTTATTATATTTTATTATVTTTATATTTAATSKTDAATVPSTEKETADTAAKSAETSSSATETATEIQSETTSETTAVE